MCIVRGTIPFLKAEETDIVLQHILLHSSLLCSVAGDKRKRENRFKSKRKSTVGLVYERAIEEETETETENSTCQFSQSL